MSYYGNGTAESAAVDRNSDGAVELCDTSLYSSTPGAYSCYTKMLYDSDIVSYAYGMVPTSNDDTYGANTSSF